jgi:predicted RNase H-like nuclease (RuvC/YqgF family)
MKGQKQSRIDSLEKRMAAMTNVMQQLIDELQHTRTLALGSLQTIKEMPGYDKAIEKLKKKNEEMQQVSEREAKLEIPNS